MVFCLGGIFKPCDDKQSFIIDQWPDHFISHYMNKVYLLAEEVEDAVDELLVPASSGLILEAVDE